MMMKKKCLLVLMATMAASADVVAAAGRTPSMTNDNHNTKKKKKVVRGASSTATATTTTRDNNSHSGQRALSKQRISYQRGGAGAERMGEGRMMGYPTSSGKGKGSKGSKGTSSSEEVSTCENVSTRYFNAQSDGGAYVLSTGGNTIDCDVVLGGDIDCSAMGATGSCITMNCDVDCTLDCNGFSIIGPGVASSATSGTQGINIPSTNDVVVTIKNCNIRDFDQCIFTSDATTATNTGNYPVPRTPDTRTDVPAPTAASPSGMTDAPTPAMNAMPIPVGEEIPVWVGGVTTTYSECPTYDYLVDNFDDGRQGWEDFLENNGNDTPLFITNQCCPARDAPGGPYIDGVTRVQSTVLEQCINGIFAQRAILELDDVVATRNYIGMWLQVCALARVKDIYFCRNGPGSGITPGGTGSFSIPCSTDPTVIDCTRGADIKYQGTGGEYGNSLYFQDADGDITFGSDINMDGRFDETIKRNGLDTFPVQDVEDNGGDYRECPPPQQPVFGDAVTCVADDPSYD